MPKKTPEPRPIVAKLKELRTEILEAHAMAGIELPEPMVQMELLQALRRVLPTYLNAELTRAWRIEDEVELPGVPDPDDGDDGAD